MLIKDLFRKALVTPATKCGFNRLLIVTGFATANMADRHMAKLAEFDTRVDIEVIVGMTRDQGIQKAQHYTFCRLVNERPYDMNLSCRYVVSGKPIHANTYCWLQDDTPSLAFAGSANYTVAAFGRSQVETLAEADSGIVFDFHKKVKRYTVNCLDSDIDQKVNLTKRIMSADGSEKKVVLSLLVKQTGETPERSGINWGQREGRELNQAYINIPAKVGKSNFFPDRYEQFTVLTDDDYSFIMVRAQDSGKGLETTQNNSLLGKYLRDRIGVNPGQYVTRQHLVKYGRTDVTFIKIDDETYIMDFRPNMGPGEDSEQWQE